MLFIYKLATHRASERASSVTRKALLVRRFRRPLRRRHACDRRRRRQDRSQVCHDRPVWRAYTDKLHIVERYRLRDYDDVKDAVDRNIKENWLMLGDIFSQHRGKFLQLHLTIEDEGVFTTPWTATLTYVQGPDQIAEQVCAENRAQYYTNDEADVPKADKQDF